MYVQSISLHYRDREPFLKNVHSYRTVVKPFGRSIFCVVNSNIEQFQFSLFYLRAHLELK